MSAAFSLNIKLEANCLIHCKEIIELLIKNEWNIRKGEEITYLPLNDDDMFEWTTSTISDSDFLKLVDEKERINELIGIEIFWTDTDIGGHLLLYSAIDFSFELNINIKFIQEEYKIPDFNWYAEKLVNILKQQYYIQEYSFEFAY